MENSKIHLEISLVALLRTYKKDLLSIFLGMLLLKIILLLISIFGADIYPFSFNNFNNNMYHSPALTEVLMKNPYFQNSLSTMLSPWDAQWYLQIAKEGYGFGLDQWGVVYNAVFFPLLPFGIYLLHFLTGSYEWAGILFANIFSLLFPILLFLLVAKEFDKKSAYTTVILLLLSPFSIFFSAIYTESIFLTFILGSILCSRYRLWYWAGIFGIFATLTKLQGIIIVPVLLTEFFLQRKESNISFQKLIWVFLPVVGILGYFVYLWILTADPLAYFHTQSLFGNTRNVGFAPFALFEEISHLSSFHSIKASPVDFTSLLLFTIILPFIWKTQRKTYFIYSLFALLMPLSTWTLTSFSRYLLISFPQFIVLGSFLSKKKPLLIIVCICFIVLSTLFSLRFINYHWVG